MKEWYEIDNANEIDTPALVVYPDRVNENIRILKQFVPDTNRLRPHVKTNKSAEISKLLIDAGITRFKCATIAEAEMLAVAGAPDVLLAYQPVGPKAERLAKLVERYPKTTFSCLVDNLEIAKHISSVFSRARKSISVYIDLNVGMNRTGIVPEVALDLYFACGKLEAVTVKGLHAYDGHIRDTDLKIRTQNGDAAFARVESLKKQILEKQSGDVTVVMGGTPTFPVHARQKDVECSPGTFIYWDMGYQQLLPDEPFLFAALVMTRVISKPAKDILCLDLGHKSIASENPIDKRVFFLNGEDLIPIGHSEEHLVVRVPENNTYEVGHLFYGVPFHICPTVALHDTATIIESRRVKSKWSILSRNRSLSV